MERFATFIPAKNIFVVTSSGIFGYRARTIAGPAEREYPGRAVAKEHGALYRLYVFQIAVADGPQGIADRGACGPSDP